jgi:hypothetical protein
MWIYAVQDRDQLSFSKKLGNYLTNLDCRLLASEADRAPWRQ